MISDEQSGLYAEQELGRENGLRMRTFRHFLLYTYKKCIYIIKMHIKV